ncbi:oxidoreductase [Glycomyces buryatensis]|uniref:SDR family NAD(P)-dependent oxidoreductase n=1 Tax=Glycomyces buryatensis TaxID=2570927 RepID=A0A4S8QDV6_9ACTN|nr:oxidoreductase [Glycomyces buryatensis]THV42767.1 SDR family NAD(P)-dependent oxidoreductase [Glycomyces buryatensis]
MSDKPWTTADIPDQTGRTFLVTGANSGLGLETTRALAGSGAHVIMAVRNEAKGRAAAAEIGAEQPGADLEVRVIDLSDLESVKAFAADFTGRLDVLVNNAGIMAPPRSLSPQGHESQFAANHLGHFALTGLLLDRIAAGADPRVVTISSLAHGHGRIHFDDLSGERNYSPTGYYGQSKFANMLFALELDRRLRAAASPVRSLVAHPGLSATNLIQSFSAPTRFVAKLVLPLITQSAAAGALPQLYAATDPRAEGGQYFGPDGKREYKGDPIIVQPVEAALDPETAKRLWDLSEELTGVNFQLPAAA